MNNPINIFLDGGDSPSLFRLTEFHGEYASGIRIDELDSNWSLELNFRDAPSAIAFRDRLNCLAVRMLENERDQTNTAIKGAGGRG